MSIIFLAHSSIRAPQSQTEQLHRPQAAFSIKHIMVDESKVYGLGLD